MKMKMVSDLAGIDDKRKFQDLALLIDRQEFISQLSRLRKTTKLNGPLDEFVGKNFIIADILLYRFNYPRNFLPAMIKIIDGSKVTNADVAEIYDPLTVTYGKYLPQDEVTYVLNINVPWKRHSKQLIKDLIQQSKKFWQSAARHPILSLDTITTIKEARKWYWKNQETDPYLGISNIAKQENEPSHRVKDGIALYRKALKIPIPERT